jgi:hypothetical protein
VKRRLPPALLLAAVAAAAPGCAFARRAIPMGQDGLGLAGEVPVEDFRDQCARTAAFVPGFPRLVADEFRRSARDFAGE